MVSGVGYRPLVTGVMRFLQAKQRNSGSVRQHHADLAQYEPLLAGSDQNLKSIAQAFAIAHDCPQFHDMRREGDGKFQGNNFASLQLAAEGCAEAVLSEGAGSAPACGRQTLTKYRYLNARVETMAGETPTALAILIGLWVIDHSKFSSADLLFGSSFPTRFFSRGEMGISPAIVLECKGRSQGHQSSCTKEVSVREGQLQYCFLKTGLRRLYRSL